eukprot:sb/3464130/
MSHENTIPISELLKLGQGTIQGRICSNSPSKVCLYDLSGKIELIPLGNILLKPSTTYQISVPSLVYGTCAVVCEETCSEVLALSLEDRKRKRRRCSSYDVFVTEKCHMFRSGEFSVTAIVEDGRDCTVYFDTKWFHFIRPGKYYRLWFKIPLKPVNGVLKLTRPHHKSHLDIDYCEVWERSEIKTRADVLLPKPGNFQGPSFVEMLKGEVTTLSKIRVWLLSVEPLENFTILQFRDEKNNIQLVRVAVTSLLPKYFVAGAQFEVGNLHVRTCEESGKATVLLTPTSFSTLIYLSLREDEQRATVSLRSLIYTLPENTSNYQHVNVVIRLDVIVALTIKKGGRVYCKVAVCDGSAAAILHLSKTDLVGVFFGLSPDDWEVIRGSDEINTGLVGTEEEHNHPAVRIFQRLYKSDIWYLVSGMPRHDNSVYPAGKTFKLPRRHITPVSIRPLGNDELFAFYEGDIVKSEVSCKREIKSECEKELATKKPKLDLEDVRT